MKVYLLVDDRIGNSNQVRALAGLLNLKGEEIFLKYNYWAFIPYLMSGLAILQEDSKNAILNLQNPTLIISAGRRASLVATYIKRIYDNVKLIQILKPESNLEIFDVVLLPEHDKKNITYPPNTTFTNGAISYFLESELKEEVTHWQPYFQHLPKPWHAVLIGGNSKKCKFTKLHIINFVENLNDFYRAHQGTFLISLSRRTPAILKDCLIKALAEHNISYYLYDPTEGGENPYKAILKLANDIIVTADSISMCSEAMIMAKPLYIFAAENLISKKHYNFYFTLLKQQIARPLDSKEDGFIPSNPHSYENLIKFIKSKIEI